MSRKHEVEVTSVINTTPDSVEISVQPVEEKSYESGQYITLELNINGEQVNRSYSFCSAPHENKWSIGVKKVDGGKASTFLNDSVKAGDIITCLDPMGNFTLPKISTDVHYYFYAAGSGITPIFSMIKTLHRSLENPRVTLCYGNKSSETAMFLKELLALASENENFKLSLLYSQSDEGKDALHRGRLSFSKTLEFTRLYPAQTPEKHAFICGPGDMITSVINGLKESGFSENEIHTEFFTAPTSEEKTESASTTTPTEDTPFSGTAKITITLDDEETTLELADGGKVILDAALDGGLDAPFSCKGGVCTACRAKLTKGKVEMMSNFALTDGEIEEGYILTCQSHPKSDVIALSYDD